MKDTEAKVHIVIDGKAANATVQDMEKNLRALYAAWRKTTVGSKEWLELGDKYKEQGDIIANVKKEVKSTESAWSKMLQTAGGVGIFKLASSAISFLASSVDRYTNFVQIADGAADKWEQTTTGLTWSWDVFKKAIATSDFSNLIDNMNAAIDAGKKYAAVMQDLEDRTRAYKIKSSQDQAEIERLKILSKNVMQPMTVRLDAAQKALDLEKKLNNEELEISKTSFKNEVDRAKTMTGLGEATIKRYFNEWNELKNLREEASNYIDVTERLNVLLNAPRGQGSIDGGQRQGAIADLEAQIANTSSEAKAYSTVVSAMNKLSQEELDSLSEKWIDVGQTQANYYTETARLQTTQSKLEKGILDDEVSEQKNADKQKIKSLDDASKYMENILTQLEETRANIASDAREKELAIEDNALKQKLAKIKGNSAEENSLRMALEIESYQKKLEINKKYDEKDQKEREEKFEKIKTDYQKVNDEIQNQLDERMSAEWDAEKMMLERTGQMTFDKRKEILAQERDIELAGAADNSEKQLLIWEDYFAKLKALNIEQVQVILNAVNSAVNVLDQIGSAFVQNDIARNNRHLKEYEKTIEKRKETLEQAYKSGQISYAEYNAGIAEADEDLAKEQQRINELNAKKEYQYSVMMIAIKEAVAIANAVALAVESSDHWLEAIVGIAAAVATVITEISMAKSKLDDAKVAQYYDGNYSVVGAGDGRTYSNVPYIGKPKTGYYSRPALIADHGGELIVDADTTRNIMINYPGLIDAINYARVPQYSAGRVPVAGDNLPGMYVSPYDALIYEELVRLNSRDIRAKIVYSEFEEISDKVARVRNAAS